MVLLHTFDDRTHKLAISCWKPLLWPKIDGILTLLQPFQHIHLFKRMHINIRYVYVYRYIYACVICVRTFWCARWCEDRVCVAGAVIRLRCMGLLCIYTKNTNTFYQLILHTAYLIRFCVVESSLETQEIFVGSSIQALLSFVCSRHSSSSRHMTCCLS